MKNYGKNHTDMEESMITLTQGGAYLLNGAEIISDSAEAAAQIKNKTGKEVSKTEAAKAPLPTTFWRNTIPPAIWRN